MNFACVFSVFEEIESLGEAIGRISDSQRIVKNLLQIQYQNVPTAALTNANFYTVQSGSPGVIFNSEFAGLFSSSVPLVLANIDARAIGTQGRQGTISETLISVSTGSVQVSELSSNIQILFPKVGVQLLFHKIVMATLGFHDIAITHILN